MFTFFNQILIGRYWLLASKNRRNAENVIANLMVCFQGFCYTFIVSFYIKAKTQF